VGDGRRTVPREVVVPLYDCEAAYALMSVMKDMNPGPGKPGPGDEWRVPAGPMDETAAQNDEAGEAACSGHVGPFRRLIHGGWLPCRIDRGATVESEIADGQVSAHSGGGMSR
jgi:hypothetical protein